MHAVVWRRVGLGEGRVDGVEVFGLVAGTGGGCGRSVACRRRGRRVALGHWRLAVGGRGRWGRCGRRGGRVRCRGSVGSGLDLGRTRLLLEDGVVAEALTLALLAVPAHGVGFVAL